jgi:hypothetical protein
MDDDKTRPIPPVPRISEVAEVGSEQLNEAQFDPKFLEAVECILRENEELLRRLAQ